MRALFSPRWILSHLFVVFVVVFMVGLGFWQLERLEQRKADNDAVRAASEADALPIDVLLAEPSVPDHTAVRVEGTYRPDLEFLVANRTFDTRPGSWLATPVELDDGRLVVVNRGWVSRRWVAGDDLRSAEAPAGPVSIEGRLFASVDGGRIGGGASSRPEVSRLDLAAVEELLGVDVAHRWVQLETQSPDGAEIPVPVPAPLLDDGPHLSYAFQWFFFSTGTVVAYVLILRRRVREPVALD